MSDSAADRLLTVVSELLVGEGYEGVSVRRVASAAGVSIGAVQHHFPTKDAMLTAAMNRAAERFRRRLEQRIDRSADPEQTLRAVADELLGADPETRATSVLWTVQAARASVDPATAARHGQEWQQVEDLLAQLLGLARPDRAAEWVRSRSAGLLALLDGLAVAQVAEPTRMSSDRARALLAVALADLLES